MLFSRSRSWSARTRINDGTRMVPQHPLDIGICHFLTAVGGVIESTVQLDMMQWQTDGIENRQQISDLFFQKSREFHDVWYRATATKCIGQTRVGADMNMMPGCFLGTVTHARRCPRMTAAGNAGRADPSHQGAGLCGGFMFSQIAVDVVDVRHFEGGKHTVAPVPVGGSGRDPHRRSLPVSGIRRWWGHRSTRRSVCRRAEFEWSRSGSVR